MLVAQALVPRVPRWVLKNPGVIRGNTVQASMFLLRRTQGVVLLCSPLSLGLRALVKW